MHTCPSLAIASLLAWRHVGRHYARVQMEDDIGTRSCATQLGLMQGNPCGYPEFLATRWPYHHTAAVSPDNILPYACGSCVEIAAINSEVGCARVVIPFKLLKGIFGCQEQPRLDCTSAFPSDRKLTANCGSGCSSSHLLFKSPIFAASASPTPSSYRGLPGRICQCSLLVTVYPFCTDRWENYACCSKV